MNVARDEGIFSAALVDEIRDARKGRGWTQAQLAERTGGSVSKASLTGYETGRRALRVSVAWVLARALDTDLSVLIGRPEHALGSGGPGVTLKVRQALDSTTSEMATVRTWLSTIYSPDVDFSTRMQVTDDALRALAVLMGVSTCQCLQHLQPFIAARDKRGP